MNCSKTYLVWVLLFISHYTAAQMFEDTWTAERSWKIQPGAQVSVNNKYGSVVVSVWEKDSVKIAVTRRVTEKSQDRLKKMTANIDVQFRQAQGAIHVETVIGSRHNSLFQNLMEAGNFSSSSPRTKVDYQIWLPRQAVLSIINKYGDVVLPSWNGQIKVDLSNGNLQAGDLNGKTELTLAFGDAQLRSVKQGKLDLNFVNFRCDNAGMLEMESRSSNIQIRKSQHLKMTSRRDQLNLGEVEHLKADTYFSVLQVAMAAKSADLGMTYGRLEGLYLHRDFERCHIVAQTCDLQLTLVEPKAYQALLKWNKNPALPRQLLPLQPDSDLSASDNPVLYFFENKGAAEKIRINFMDSYLNLEHKRATPQ